MMSTQWPYLKLLHPSITESTYGLMNGIAALGNIGASLLAGWASNKLSNTKQALLLGKILALFSAICYMFIEVWVSLVIVLFFLFNIIEMTALGFCSVYRTHIAMNSQDSERSKAFGITSFAGSIAFVIGPLLQMFFTLFGYPGIHLMYGIHWNLYTAPNFLAFCMSIVGIILIIFWFDGRMHVKKRTSGESTPTVVETEISLSDLMESESDKSDSTVNLAKKPDNFNYDIIAVIVMIIMKIGSELNMEGVITR
uniref:Uncharacterized protein n=1 Tax=Panagrolaimus sp. JU765 TaxID=591449 RepID=A0AC34PWJ2_9BILA